MSLSANWALYFDNATKVGGRACFDEQAVQPQECGRGEMFRAQVRDETGDCTVAIQGEGEPNDFSCSCQTFADGRFCKHIWAALLYLEHYADELDTEVNATQEEGHRLPKARKRSGDRPATRDAEPEWISRLNLVRTSALHDEHNGSAERLDFMQVCYVIDPELCRQRQQLVVELFQRRLSTQGWTKPKRLKMDAAATATLPETEDRELCALLMGADWIARQNGTRAGGANVDYYDYYENPRTRSAYGTAPHAWWGMLRRMLDTQRCFIAAEHGPQPLMLDDRSDLGPWVLWLVGEVNDAQLELTIELRRGNQRMTIERPALVLSGTEADGMVVYDGKVARFDDRQAGKWVSHFRDDLHKYGEVRPIVVPIDEVSRFLERLYLLADLPEIDLPEGVGRGEEHIEVTPLLELSSPPVGASRKLLSAQVFFAYGPHRITPGQRGRFVAAPMATENESLAPSQTLNGEQVADLPPTIGPLIRRDLHREQALYASLLRAGFHPGTGAESDRLFIAAKRMPTVVGQLIAQGWQISADQRLVRAAGAPHLSVSSGIDWFELRGSVAYDTAAGTQHIELPHILHALKQGHATIKLDDGSEGLLPHEWLEQHGLLTAMGKMQDDHLRFRSSQAALLDALLARQQHVTCDEVFATARERLHQFEGITPLHPAPTFVGSLRPYQCEGLGWCQFLRAFGMGGILADDMGLGKTVQILAMLDSRYGKMADGEGKAKHDDGQHPSSTHRPTLIVVPRSVVFNWMDEAQKFAPRLRVQAYTGSDRHALREAFVDHDVIITSYGLMRRDIDELRDHRFDYIVLDEAQAIKNPASQSAKAARLLRGDHKLALTGTPVENHLGDLWSIFEFLNPGMLGSNTRFAELLRQGISTDTVTVRNGVSDPNASMQVARALQPFILRRTKQQVLHDLPEKTEQTIHCEMEPEQRAIYDEMRAYYRQTLLSQVGRSGDGSSTVFEGSAGGSATPMLVLEALLRLRQAACHPALINDKYADKPSAKLEVLMDRLSDLIDEGHKALVFSQFTSMLALVRKQLDDRGIPYAYLDGQTRKRKQVVDRFQNDGNCPVFLISLKAGGFGLNLTAAEYVFILDPWWNPAVETQAIDRTHRIGQTQHVFAYRLICEETVEQRILELQDKKKRLADAIIGGQENLLRSLTRDDLERLLS